jgi:biopolymer transport protein ExbB
MDSLSSMGAAFAGGGFWMYPILAAQIVSIAIIIERVFALYINRSLNQEKIGKTLEEEIRKGSVEKALDKAKSMSGRPAVAIATAAGAQSAIGFGGREEIQAKMDQVLVKEQNNVENRIEFLATLGNVATLMGLLGTIVGMIKSFAAISNASEELKSALLSAGISEAMNATAYGLITAIPALVMYAFLTNRANKINEDLVNGATRVFNALAFHHESVPGKTKKSSASLNV